VWLQLHKLIDSIAEADPAARIHLIAHSHGGNVLLKTIDLVSLLSQSLIDCSKGSADLLQQQAHVLQCA